RPHASQELIGRACQSIHLAQDQIQLTSMRAVRSQVLGQDGGNGLDGRQRVFHLVGDGAGQQSQRRQFLVLQSPPFRLQTFCLKQTVVGGDCQLLDQKQDGVGFFLTQVAIVIAPADDEQAGNLGPDLYHRQGRRRLLKTAQHFSVRRLPPRTGNHVGR